ncbi:hypothetical protein D3C87_2018060 [compost metagenome]
MSSDRKRMIGDDLIAAGHFCHEQKLFRRIEIIIERFRPVDFGNADRNGDIDHLALPADGP